MTATPLPIPCTPAEARALTDEIKSSVERSWRLLGDAYERRVWEALRYPSWRDYAMTEFGLSQSRVYQLLDAHKVASEIEAVACISTSVELTEPAARELKPHLEEVTERVAAALDGRPEVDRAAVTAEVIRDARAEYAAEREREKAAREQSAADGEVALPAAEWAAANPALTLVPADEPDEPEDLAPYTGPQPAAPPLPKPKPPRPTLLDAFSDAAFALRKAVDTIERLAADDRFDSNAKALASRYRGGLDYAIDGLTGVRARILERAK